MTLSSSLNLYMLSQCGFKPVIAKDGIRLSFFLKIRKFVEHD